MTNNNDLIKKLKIGFMGTPSFAVPILNSLIKDNYRIVFVYTQSGRPAGRGLRKKNSEIYEVAKANNINIRVPEKLDDEEINFISNKEIDIIIVAAYGLILPERILKIPKYGCLNVHASLLPKWRGAAPIQRSIMAGDKKTGISYMLMDKGLDTGPVILQKETKIGEGQAKKAPLSLTGANLKQSSGDYTDSWTLQDGLMYSALLYFLSIIAVLVVWGRNQTSDSRAAKGASRGRRKTVRDALKVAETLNLRESSGVLRSALKELSRHEEVNCKVVLSELEKESFDPKASEKVISSNLAAQIRALLVWCMVVLMGSMLSTATFAQSPQELYDSAMAIEDIQERIEGFEYAAKAYRTKCEEVPNSADVWVDFGNASLGARKYGDAMVGYLRALQIDPQHMRAQQNRSWVVYQ